MQQARRSWQDFLDRAPAWPDGAFRGQGVVTLAGGNTFLVPAWVMIHTLRRSGTLHSRVCGPG